MKILGIIPARAGSKRIPGKNMRALGGKPLTGWVLDAAFAATRLDAIAVSSDDPDVLALAGRSPGCFAIARPAELASDTAPAIGYVQHALEWMARHQGRHFDGVAILQPSSPFTEPEDIDATVSLLDRSGASSAVTVVKLDHAIHPVKLKLLDGDRLLPFLEDERGRMAAHELPDIYVRNCAVYAARSELVAQGQIIGDDCRAVLMPRERSLDINDPIDLELAEFMLQRQQAQAATRS